MRIAARYFNGLWYILKNINYLGHPDLHVCHYSLDQYGLEKKHFHYKLTRYVKEKHKAFYEQIELMPEDIYFCKKHLRKDKD